MLKERVLPADLFTVIHRTIKMEQDRLILMMLYQPIIGSDAISLYFSLETYLDQENVLSQEWTHHHLMTNLGLSLEQIVTAREKLEAVGLLKSYVKRGEINHFAYEVYAPVSAFEFFENPLLAVALQSNIGKQEYKRVVSFFQIPSISLEGYEAISCKFSEVFVEGDMTNYEAVLEEFRTSKKSKLEIVSEIDLEHVLSLIPEEMLNPRSITASCKDFLYRITFVYGFDEDSLVEIIKNSLLPNRTIDKNLVQEKAKRFYQFEHCGKLPDLALKSQPEFLRKNVLATSVRHRKIYEFETISPYDYLYSRNLGNKLTTNEIKILEYLLVTVHLNPGVVNVLLDYILRENDNKLIFRYVEEVAGLFSRNKIETVEEAMKLAEKEHKNRQKSKQAKKVGTKKIENKPTWFNQSVEAKEVSLAKQKELEERLSKVIK